MNSVWVMTTTNTALETMKTIRFGLEVEFIGRRAAIAEAVRSVVGGSIRHIGYPSCYDPREITAPDGRVWKVWRDGSLNGRGGDEGGAELIAPICTYEDIETIQEIIRACRKAGARVNDTCGIHVHLDGARFNAKEIARLAKLVYSQEDLIYKALKSEDRRAGQGSVPCREVGERFIQDLRRMGSRESMQELNRIWYNGNSSRASIHYDFSRYAGLNLHSLFYRGTIEFRYFHSTTHAGAVKSYIQLCLALGAKALTSRGAVARKRNYNTANPRYAFRTFLIRLGLNGEDFKTLRHHLLNHLPGNASWAGERRPAAAPAAAPAAPAATGMTLAQLEATTQLGAQ